MQNRKTAIVKVYLLRAGLAEGQDKMQTALCTYHGSDNPPGAGTVIAWKTAHGALPRLTDWPVSPLAAQP